MSKITSRANTISHNIFRTFSSQDHQLYIQLYKWHIRPLLEYNTSIWTPHQISDIKLAEIAQRKFTKRLCQRSNIKFDSYKHRLETLHLDTLEVRRVKFDLINMYKIYHNIVDLNFKEFFGINLSNFKYNTRGHKHRLQIPKYSGSTIHQNFFCNRIINVWNQLPSDLIDSASLQIFKIKLKKYDITTIYSGKI